MVTLRPSWCHRAIVDRRWSWSSHADPVMDTGRRTATIAMSITRAMAVRPAVFATAATIGITVVTDGSDTLSR